MPTYEYACETCGGFEVQQSMTEPALTRCPTCGGPVRRLISGGTGFIMGGGGSGGGGTRRDACDRETPCCGRATRCDKPPCGS